MGAEQAQANQNGTAEDGGQSYRDVKHEVSFDLPAIGQSQMAKDRKKEITGSGHKRKESREGFNEMNELSIILPNDKCPGD